MENLENLDFWDLENYGFFHQEFLDNLNLWRGKAFITIFSSSSSSCHQRHHHLEDDIDDDHQQMSADVISKLVQLRHK